MDRTLCEKIDTMLTSAQATSDDPDVSFKIRTARQMLVACDEILREHGDAPEHSDPDGETRENLERLGFLD